MKKINKSKIIIKDSVIGIATSIDIAYSRCHRIALVSPSGTRYTRNKLKGKNSITAIVISFS